MDACRLVRMTGSAVVTMLASSWPMKVPTQTVPTASHGAACSARMRAGRAGSVSILGVTRRGASGSGTRVGPYSLTARLCDRHEDIIQHRRDLSGRVGGPCLHPVTERWSPRSDQPCARYCVHTPVHAPREAATVDPAAHPSR